MKFTLYVKMPEIISEAIFCARHDKGQPPPTDAQAKEFVAAIAKLGISDESFYLMWDSEKPNELKVHSYGDKQQVTLGLIQQQGG